MPNTKAQTAVNQSRKAMLNCIGLFFLFAVGTRMLIGVTHLGVPLPLSKFGSPHVRRL